MTFDLDPVTFDLKILSAVIYPKPLAAGSSNCAGMFLRGSSYATSWSDLCMTSYLDPMTFDLDIHFGLDTVKIFSGTEGYSATRYVQY